MQLPHPPVLLLLSLSGVLLSGLAAAADSDSGPAGIEEVIVTATMLPRRPDEIAGTVTLIDSRAIERQLADDLDDLVRYQPGLSMDSSARGGDQGFVIRGIGGNRVLTVIDGVRSNDIYAAGPASYGKDLFEVDDLKAVEIIRGPASVLYGADAMGGAVILRSKDPLDYLQDGQNARWSLRTSADSANAQLKTGIGHAWQGETIGTVVQLTRRQAEEQDVAGIGRHNPQDGETLSGFIKTVWEPAVDHRITLTADLSDEEVDTRIDSDLSTSVTRSEGLDDSRRRRISISHDWAAAAMFADNVRLQLHYHDTDATQFTDQELTSYAFIDPRVPASFRGARAQRQSRFEFNQDTTSGSLLFSRSFALGETEHALVYGLSAERTNTERPRFRCDTELSGGAVSCAIPSYPMAPPEVFPNKTFPDTRTTRTGIFWQDEIQLTGRVILIPGLRYDRYQMDPRPDELLNGSGDIANFGGYAVTDVKEEEMTGNLGLLYLVNDQLTLFAQYAEGFRPPNFDESNQAFVNLAHGYATVPNPELEAEYSRSAEAGVRGSFGDVMASLSVYSNRYDNFIESQQVGSVNGISLFQDANIGEAHIYGSEASLDWLVSESWRFRGALVWSRGEDTVADVPLDSVEPLTATLALQFQPVERWSIEGVLTLVAEQDRVSSATRVRGDGYEVLDLLGSYAVTDNARLRLGVFNVLDTRYARWSSIKGLAADDLATIANAQAPGRSVRIGFDLQF